MLFSYDDRLPENGFQAEIADRPDLDQLHQRRRACSASLTVEAALVLPVMMLAVYILLFPLKALESERQLKNKMDSVARSLTVGAYMEETGEKLLKTGEKDETAKELLNGLTEGAALALIAAEADEETMRNIRFDESTAILSKNEGDDPAMVNIKLMYDLDLPVSVFRIAPVTGSVVVSRRAWVGSAGGRGRDRYGTEDDRQKAEETEEDKTVYVGQNSTRYHLDPHCHYLYNEMETADAALINNKRNSSGGKYHACPSCRPGTSGTVYYFKSGTAYHSDPDCKAITAYVKEVKLSEVESLGPCSYCGKTH